MIDIHTHILPGLDDGADSMTTALAMARAAAKEGITDIIATPHHVNGNYRNPASDVQTAVWNFQSRLQTEGIPVTLHPGQEIRVHDDLIAARDRGELLTLAGTSYLLIEMPGHEFPKEMKELVSNLAGKGLRPVIAHPERNRVIRENHRLLAELVQLGASAQVTTHSLLGEFGERIEKSAWSLCRSGLIHLVSSDAHHVERRAFSLTQAYREISDRLGPEWSEYYRNNAASLLANEPFAPNPALAKEPNLLHKFTKLFGTRA
ncbi:tyrosine-protein phosphatase [Cohnella sp. GCM10027633]|uniref:tyrosine-protein phosphatase n=1 Tax=unclassified Cohnella TaxID=2636738 RepID=UPI0036365A5A